MMKDGADPVRISRRKREKISRKRRGIVECRLSVPAADVPVIRLLAERMRHDPGFGRKLMGELAPQRIVQSVIVQLANAPAKGSTKRTAKRAPNAATGDLFDT